jgi:hypothetical protein
MTSSSQTTFARPFAKPLMPWLVCVAAISGCGEPNALNRQAIQGTVSLDGKALAMGTIRFSPEIESGVASGGPIADGSFSVPAVDGLPPGKYIVRIYATEQDNRVVEGEPPGLATQKPAVDLIPSQYNARSELTCEVVDGEDNKFVFDLKSGERNP